MPATSAGNGANAARPLSGPPVPSPPDAAPPDASSGVDPVWDVWPRKESRFIRRLDGRGGRAEPNVSRRHQAKPNLLNLQRPVLLPPRSECQHPISISHAFLIEPHTPFCEQSRRTASSINDKIFGCHRWVLRFPYQSMQKKTPQIS